MINSVIGQFTQQPPVSKALQPTQAPENPSNTPSVPQGPQPAPSQPASVSSGKAEEINSKVALSRDTARIDPSQVTNDSQQRGQRLDISV